MTTHSLVIPVYRNAENMPSLFAALEKLNDALAGDFEVVFVVDGSPDESEALILRTPRRFRSTMVVHSRNFGAFTAIRTGMEHATGRHVAVMAADLQEPPELVLEFFALLAADEADVIFGKRASRSDPLLTRTLSRAFWGFYRRFVLRDMPSGGVDVFACNRAVVEAVLSIEEPNSSLVAQLFWVGFRREFVSYERRGREHGVSAWNFSRRLRYMMDSIFSFSDLPILMLLWVGLIGCAVSLLVAIVTVAAHLTGYIKVPGYATIVLLILFFGSLGLTVQGIIGCYLWRALENTKRRPLRIIRSVAAIDGDRAP